MVPIGYGITFFVKADVLSEFIQNMLVKLASSPNEQILKLINLMLILDWPKPTDRVASVFPNKSLARIQTSENGISKTVFRDVVRMHDEFSPR